MPIVLDLELWLQDPNSRSCTEAPNREPVEFRLEIFLETGSQLETQMTVQEVSEQEVDIVEAKPEPREGPGQEATTDLACEPELVSPHQSSTEEDSFQS